MTTIILDSDYHSNLLRRSYRDEFKYWLSKGKIIEALANVGSRDDIVRLVRDYGLTRSWLKDQASKGKGKEMLDSIKRHAGIVWYTAYLSGLSDEDLNKMGGDAAVYIQGRNNLRWNNEIEFMSYLDHPQFLILPPMRYYYMLLVCGIACDVESVKKCVETMPSSSDDQEMLTINEQWYDHYGLEDPVSELLLDLFKPPYSLEFNGLDQITYYGVTGTYHIDANVPTITTQQYKPVIQHTRWGLIQGIKLMPMKFYDYYDEEGVHAGYYDGKYSFHYLDREDGDMQLHTIDSKDGESMDPSDFPSLFIDNISNVPGIDGFFLAQELYNSGIDYHKYGIHIPSDLEDYFKRVDHVEYWPRGSLIVNRDQSYEIYDDALEDLSYDKDTGRLSLGYVILSHIVAANGNVYIDFEPIPIDGQTRNFTAHYDAPETLDVTISITNTVVTLW